MSDIEQQLREARDEIKVLQDNLRDCIERLAGEMRLRYQVVGHCKRHNHSGVNAGAQSAYLEVLKIYGEYEPTKERE